jgi:ABC-type Mn2+/Zn2+ transport system permease subunit/Mn-dependent DtxR family transcriptional regulator
MTLAELLSQEWALRALLASTMVGLMCGVLGSFIVLRNMALIGDALAHAILPGVVFAFMIVGYSALGFFTGAVLAGLFAAVGITWIQHNIKTKNDAAIGIVFTAMFSVGVMGISYISRNEGVHLDLKDFLFGNVLGVANEDLYLTAAITVYVLISVVVFYRYLFVTTFQPVIAQTMGISVRLIHYFLMLLLSFAVVASLQTVGVILVVAMLITPASTALLISDRLPVVLLLSAILGMLSAISGLFFAIWLETTPGPAMAVAATVFYLIAALFAPQKGYVNRGLRRRKLQSRIIREDILKHLFRMEKQGPVTEEQLSGKLGLRKQNLLRHISRLRRKEWIEPDRLGLSPSGKEQANRLIRAHRLWETFLVDKIGLSAEQIHEDAERYEHLLSEELLDELDAQLGFPRKDPHGSPIPGKKGGPDFPLSHLPEKAFGRISGAQINEHITNRLWELGLLPDLQFRVCEKTMDQVSIEQNDQVLHLPLTLAKLVNVVEEGTGNPAS